MNYSTFESQTGSVSPLFACVDNSARTITKMVSRHNTSMVSWIVGFCDYLPFAEAQDIVQASLISLWQWCEKKGNIVLSDNEFLRLWKTFSKSNLLHWRRKDNMFCSFEKTALSYYNEDDLKAHEAQEELNELFQVLSDKERKLIIMSLDGMSPDDICIELGYKNKYVLKNIKCRAMRKMKNAALGNRLNHLPR